MISRNSSVSSKKVSRQNSSRTANANLAHNAAFSHAEHTTGVNTPAEEQTCDDNLSPDNEDIHVRVSNNEPPRMIGPLSESERMTKVLKYLHKKINKSSMKKFCYKCRKQIGRAHV